MSLSWIIYFTGFISNLHGLAVGVVVLSSAAFMGLILYSFVEETHEYINLIKKALAVCAVAVVFAVICPSRETIIAIVAAQYAESFVKNETLQTVVDPAIDLLKTWIAEETKKLNKGG